MTGASITNHHHHHKESSTMDETETTIPIDVITEILSNLPFKSTVRFRCVSKLWATTLAGSYFTDLFLTRSCARPRLLFANQALHQNELHFYSSPQHPNDENTSSSSFVVDVDFCIRCLDHHGIRAPVSGLILCPRKQFHGIELLICNPTTKQQYVSLPIAEPDRGYQSFFLVYDPIDRQYKILCMSYKPGGEVYGSHILTLGSSAWRSIECPTIHEILTGGICINGVLYYLARTRGGASRDLLAVFFDVRSEKFKFVGEIPEATALWSKRRPGYCRVTTNLEGKLVLITWRALGNGKSRLELSLRVLEDCKKPEWSKHVYRLSLPYDVAASVVGIIGGTGEIVLTTAFVTSNLFYVFYFHPKTNTLKELKIQGIKAYRGFEVLTFLGHVENLNIIT